MVSCITNYHLLFISRRCHVLMAIKKLFFWSLISSFLSSSTFFFFLFDFSQYISFFCWHPLQRMSLCEVRLGERQVGDFRSEGLRQNGAAELGPRSQSWLGCPCKFYLPLFKIKDTVASTFSRQAHLHNAILHAWGGG